MYSEIITKTKGAHLPHWQTKDGIYFATFRLAGSLPSHLKKNRELLKEEIVQNSKKKSLAPFEVDELEDIHFEEMRLKRHDKGHALLQDDRIAQIVADALQYFDNDHYRLYA